MSIPDSQTASAHPRSATAIDADWRAVMADSVTDVGELGRLLDLPPSVTPSASRSAESFRLLVPRTYLARIKPGDPQDPLLLQVLPREEEREASERFTADPLGEVDAVQRGGWLWKYGSRSLIVTTGACGVHCRFCFRRHFPYQATAEASGAWEPVLEEIGRQESIHEVILSGGDPLTLEDPVLEGLARRLAEIPHLQRIRLHTRLPILIPQRVTEGLLGWLTGNRLTPLVVVHVNHPAEIDRAVAEGLARLIDRGIPVLSQSVLLQGVNDQVEVLARLFERLVDLRVMPYYLHQLDRVAGAAHFEVPEQNGIDLIRQLRTRLPGYAVPRYVRETLGEPNKVVLA